MTSEITSIAGEQQERRANEQTQTPRLLLAHSIDVLSLGPSLDSDAWVSEVRSRRREENTERDMCGLWAARKGERMSEEVGSRNVWRGESKEYWITAGGWNGGYGESFEIGIRRKSDGQFTLVQGEWNEQTVVKAAGAVILMLDNGYRPSEIQGVFP